MSKSTVPSLIVFVKNPKLGQVKTRIAATAGPEKALAIYHILQEKTRELALSFKGDRLLFYSNEIVSDEWSDAHFLKLNQKGTDLGQRMYNALSYALSFCEKAILIGSDCPTITTQILENAVKALDKNDLVLGPSKDGGYYLIGMKNAIWDIFDQINWSTETVLRETIQKAKDRNCTVQLLEKLSDIDTEKDWNEYHQKQLSNDKTIT